MLRTVCLLSVCVVGCGRPGPGSPKSLDTSPEESFTLEMATAFEQEDSQIDAVPESGKQLALRVDFGRLTTVVYLSKPYNACQKSQENCGRIKKQFVSAVRQVVAQERSGAPLKTGDLRLIIRAGKPIDGVYAWPLGSDLTMILAVDRPRAIRRVTNKDELPADVEQCVKAALANTKQTLEKATIAKMPHYTMVHHDYAAAWILTDDFERSAKDKGQLLVAMPEQNVLLYAPRSPDNLTAMREAIAKGTAGSSNVVSMLVYVFDGDTLKVAEE